MDRVRKASFAQGIYYLATGVTPFVSRRGFETITGSKREWWLVQTVGLLVTTVGVGLIGAAARDRVTPELKAIATGCAASLATIDVVHVARGRIATTYLADAAVEVALLAGLWAPRGTSAALGGGAPA